MRKNKIQLKQVENNELKVVIEPGRVVKTQLNPLRRKYIKYPKFRKFLDGLDMFMNWSSIVTSIVSFIFLLITIGIVYYLLPENIKETVTAIFGGFLSLIAIPLYLDGKNKRMEIRNEQYNNSKDFYLNLSKAIHDVLRTNDKEKIKELIKIIDENASEISINLPNKIYDDLMSLYEECVLSLSSDTIVNSNIDMIQYFGIKCINNIRHQGNVTGNYYFSNLMINAKDDANE